MSRRIEDEEERQRLRDVVLALKPAGAGFIIRTVCVGLSRSELQADMRFLIELWNRILKRSENVSAPCQLHYDMDLTLRSIRDLFTPDVEQRRRRPSAAITSASSSSSTRSRPRLKSRVELHEAPEPLFDQYGIEQAISRALERRVWLKSGGYIVIDQTEALDDDRRQHRPLRRQAATTRKPSSRPTSKPPGRSSISSASATSAASSSSTSST